MTSPAARSHLLARLMAVSAVAAACGGSGGVHGTDTTDTRAPAGAGGQAGASGGSGQGGAGAAGASGAPQAGASGCVGEAPTCEMECSDAWPPALCKDGQWWCPTDSGGPHCNPLGGTIGAGGAGAGGAAGTGGAVDAGGAAGAVDAGGAAGAVEAGGAAGAAAGQAGAGGSEPLPVCEPGPGCTGMICYARGQDEVCEPLESPLASAKLGCQLGPVFNAAYPQEEQCCYGQFCGGGRPLRVDGLPTRSLALRRGDWS